LTSGNVFVFLLLMSTPNLRLTHFNIEVFNKKRYNNFLKFFIKENTYI